MKTHPVLLLVLFSIVSTASFIGTPITLPVLAYDTPSIEGCPIFPTENVWNTPVDNLPVDARSASYIATIGADEPVHPDFGSGTWDGGPIGIPYNVVPGTQPKVDVTFGYMDESDPGPYPIPPDAAIEGGSQSNGDRHILVLDRDNCMLYELYSAYPQPDGSWYAGSGAIFDLNSHALRHSGWTSADAAGLAILPGLVRYDEVAAGEIRHAVRFTVPQTRREYIWPARHYASSLTGLKYPPMGQRFRLKADFDISDFSPEVQVILRALKKYGMVLADNGAPWFISGVPDERWNNDILVNELRRVKGLDFEAVDESSLMVDPDSGQAAQLDEPALNPKPPENPVRLIFIHHSTGQNWLSDGNGRLGIALKENNYFVSDTNYGWGSDSIGDYTDIGHWWLWFRGPHSSTYLDALYNEGQQHSSYSRLLNEPAGENEIIMFKSCFPNSALKGSPSDPVPPIDSNPLRGENCGSDYHTVANAKGVYNDLLPYFAGRQDKLFLVITAPPLTDAAYAENARAFNQWLVNDWLKGYSYHNVAVFDFYTVLTTNGGNANTNDLNQEGGNHHRWWNNTIQHIANGDDDDNPNVLEYPTGDDHPSQAGNLKSTGELPALLNIYYNCWKGMGGCPGEEMSDQPDISVEPPSHDFKRVYVESSSGTQSFTISNTGTADLVITNITLQGEQADQFAIQNNACSGQIISPTSNCALGIVFSPSSAGRKSAYLKIESNDPDTPVYSVELSGTGARRLTVTTPNGGENWRIGSVRRIQWRYTGNSGPYVKIQLLKNGVLYRTIRSTTPAGSGGSGSYDWRIPSGLTSGPDYKIRVKSTTNGSYIDNSDRCFSISR